MDCDIHIDLKGEDGKLSGEIAVAGTDMGIGGGIYSILMELHRNKMTNSALRQAINCYLDVASGDE